MANKTMYIFNLASSLFILSLSLALMLLFSKQFTTYEKSWFMTIMVLATIFAVAFPEESANGVNGIVIMLLYLLDTFLNILCELLISKQSRYNFLVSVVCRNCGNRNVYCINVSFCNNGDYIILLASN